MVITSKINLKINLLVNIQFKGKLIILESIIDIVVIHNQINSFLNLIIKAIIR